MITLLDIIKAVRIDFSEGLIILDDLYNLDFQFDISPKDFLSFSKKDFKLKSKQGKINALTNAKRAIDCQVDKIISSFGINSKEFPPTLIEFLTKSKNAPIKKNLPIKLKFVQAMNIAPSELIANARHLRNKLEHYYQEPAYEEVSSAIELAELFILATDSKLNNLRDFYLTDKLKHNVNKSYIWDSVEFRYNNEKQLFEICGYVGKNEKKEIIIDNNCIEFYYILKIATSLDYIEDIENSTKDLIEFIGHPIPKNKILIDCQ